MFRNIFCIFLVQFLFWFLLLCDTDSLTKVNLAYGLCCCVFVAYITYKTGIITADSSFLFLQIGFYRFFASIMYNLLRQSCVLAVAFWSHQEEDFDVSAKDLWLKGAREEAEIAMFVNMLNLIPGIACIEVNKDRLLYYKLSNRYFSDRDLELMEAKISEVNDEKLV